MARAGDELGGFTLTEIVHRGGMEEQGGVSVVEALRPDGTTRRFAFGAVTARTAKQGR